MAAQPVAPERTSTWLQAFRAHWRAEDAASARWRERLRERLPATAALLRDRFGVRRVLLFGSLARDEASPGSDVDLLVEGLRPADWPAAASAVAACLGLDSVDLVRAEVVRPSVRARADAEGEVLLG